MPDSETLKAILEAVGVAKTERSEKSRGRCDEEEECAVPEKIIYIIFTKCVTINNGACEDWKFCQADGPCVD